MTKSAASIRSTCAVPAVLVDADAAPGVPDGATVDAEGFIWNARYKGGCLARFAPDGRLDRLIELPVLESQPLAGSLLALDVGVAGRLEPAFSG